MHIFKWYVWYKWLTFGPIYKSVYGKLEKVSEKSGNFDVEDDNQAATLANSVGPNRTAP